MVQLKLISEEAPPLCKSNQSLFKVKKKTFTGHIAIVHVSEITYLGVQRNQV